MVKFIYAFNCSCLRTSLTSDLIIVVYEPVTYMTPENDLQILKDLLRNTILVKVVFTDLKKQHRIMMQSTQHCCRFRIYKNYENFCSEFSYEFVQLWEVEECYRLAIEIVENMRVVIDIDGVLL